MSTSVRLCTLGAAGLLATASLFSAAPVGAAPGPGGPPATVPLDRSAPGKGDTDGDRIADDLEVAVSRAGATERVAVIVQGTTPDAARRAAPALSVERRFTTIPAFAASVPAGMVTALSRVPGVTRVELNGVTRVLDASGNQDYGVVAARDAVAPGDGSLDGSGVGICIIDTGVDPNHEQLVNHVVGFKDWVNGRTVAYDDHGHGTHVAGIATGSPTGSSNAAYAGVAPGAKVVSAKVLSSAGSGADADVVSAIEWCAARSDVRVISMSLGSPASDGSDAGSQAVNAAFRAGKVVVVAAGNSGDAPGTIASPGVATDAVTVGAASDPSSLAGSGDTDTSLYLAGFSSRGPTANPSAPHKPDVVAPGLSVVAAKANTVSSYTAMSGTSMATPFVAGVVALGLEAKPGVTPAAVKAALHASAKDAGATGTDDEWGAGLVDARKFVAALGAAPAGTAAWPDRTVITGSVASGGVRSFPINVGTAGRPLGVTLQTTNGAASCVLPVGGACWYGYEWAPDLDAYLVNPSGNVVAMSRCMLESTNGNCAAPGRFETVGVASAAAGTWQLRVESFSGSGSFSADVFGALGAVTPSAPSAPTGLTATATSSTSVSLAWTDTSSDESGFEVQRCTGSTCAETDFATVATPGQNATGYLDTNRAPSTSYGYRVRAVNGSLTSAWTAPRYETTPALPAAPTALVATTASSGSVNLTWTDASSDETGFTLQRCAGSQCTNFAYIASPGANAVSYTDSGLAAGTTYRYRIQSVRHADVSAWTGPAEATTSGAPAPTVPSAPTGLTATAVSGTTVDLRWNDTSGNETGFRLERCPGSKCTNFAAIATPAADSIFYRDTTGLRAGTTYRYRIQAFNATGFSAYTPIVTVKTLRR